MRLYFVQHAISIPCGVDGMVLSIWSSIQRDNKEYWHHLWKYLDPKSYTKRPEYLMTDRCSNKDGGAMGITAHSLLLYIKIDLF